MYLTFFFDPSQTRGRLRRQLRAAAGRRRCRRPTSRRSTSASTCGPAWSCARSTTGRRCCSSPRSSCTSCRVFFTGAFRRPRELNWIDRRARCCARHRQRLRRLLAARRPAVGHRACASPTRSRCRSRSSARGSRRCSSAASSRARTSSPGSTCIHILLIPALIVGAARPRTWRSSCARSTPSSPGPGRARGQRRGRAPVADLRGQGARPVLPHRRGAVAARRRWPRSTRSGSTGRSTRPRCRPRQPARLVHGLARRRAAAHAGVGDPGLRLRDPEPVLPRRAAGRAHLHAAVRCGRSSRPASPATTPSTTCSTAPRQRPVRTALGVATLAFYAILLPRRRRPTCCRRRSACR